MKVLEEFELEERNLDPVKDYRLAIDAVREAITLSPSWRWYESTEMIAGLPRRLIIGTTDQDEKRTEHFIKGRLEEQGLPYVRREEFKEYRSQEEFDLAS